MTNDEILASADALLDEATDLIMNNKPNEADRIVRQVQRARIAAIKAIKPPEKARRLELLMDLLFTAAATEDRRRVVWAVRQAVLCDPSEEQTEGLRDYWEDSSWILKGDRSFPSEAVDEERPFRPSPDQMSFLEVDA